MLCPFGVSGTYLLGAKDIELCLEAHRLDHIVRSIICGFDKHGAQRKASEPD